MSENKIQKSDNTKISKQLEQKQYYDNLIYILEDKHIDGAAKVFAKSFCKFEPLVKCLGITEDEFMPLAISIITKAAKDGLSVVSVDKSNKVVGCAIAENFHSPLILEPTLRFAPIFAVFEALSTTVSEMDFVKDTVAHIWITAVDESIQGHGLSTRLNNACVMRALELRFRYFYCEFTNPINEKIMQYFPESIRLNKVSLKDFIFEGEAPFAGIEGFATSYIATTAPYIRLSELEKHNKNLSKIVT